MSPNWPLICDRPWTSAFIRLDGGITFCCHLPRPEAVLGNLREGSFEELWNGPLAREIRERLLRGTLPSLCRDCPISEVRERAAQASRWRPFDEAEAAAVGGPVGTPGLAGEGRLFRLGMGWWEEERSATDPLRWGQRRAEIYLNRTLLPGQPGAEQAEEGSRARRRGRTMAAAGGQRRLLLDLCATRGDGEPATRLRLQWEGLDGPEEFELAAGCRELLPLILPDELLDAAGGSPLAAASDGAGRDDGGEQGAGRRGAHGRRRAGAPSRPEQPAVVADSPESRRGHSREVPPGAIGGSAGEKQERGEAGGDARAIAAAAAACPTLLVTLEVLNPWVPGRSQPGSTDERELGVVFAGLRLDDGGGQGGRRQGLRGLFRSRGRG